MKKNILLVFFLIISIGSMSTHAEHNGSKDHDHESKPIKNNLRHVSDVSVLSNEAVIIVHGIVCSFCSQGVTRNLSKLPFVDKSKYTKGVKVEIESQKVTVAIKTDSMPDLTQIFESILKGGYEPVEAYVRDVDGNIKLHKAE